MTPLYLIFVSEVGDDEGEDEVKLVSKQMPT